MRKKPVYTYGDLTQEELLYSLEYNTSSPTCLLWKIGAKMRDGRVDRKQIGKKAGSFCKSRTRKLFISLSISNNRMSASRAIWIMFNGPIAEGMVIDHLNGDPWDNRIENLACKTRKENNQNFCKNIKNTSGVTGVGWLTKRTKIGNLVTNAVATVHIGDKIKSKSYSSHKYGLIPAFYLVCLWRKNKIKELNENGAKYTERN